MNPRQLLLLLVKMVVNCVRGIFSSHETEKEAGPEVAPVMPPVVRRLQRRELKALRRHRRNLRRRCAHGRQARVSPRKRARTHSTRGVESHLVGYRRTARLKHAQRRPGLFERDRVNAVLEILSSSDSNGWVSARAHRRRPGLLSRTMRVRPSRVGSAWEVMQPRRKAPVSVHQSKKAATDAAVEALHRKGGGCFLVLDGSGNVVDTQVIWPVEDRPMAGLLALRPQEPATGIRNLSRVRGTRTTSVHGR